MNISKVRYDELNTLLNLAKEDTAFWTQVANKNGDIAEGNRKVLEKVYRASRGVPLNNPSSSAGHAINTYSPFPGYEAPVEPQRELTVLERAENRLEEAQGRILELEKRLTAVQAVIECSGVLN